jgi:hypothetical protein
MIKRTEEQNEFYREVSSDFDYSWGPIIATCMPLAAWLIFFLFLKLTSFLG